jgi:hypothetical protein
MKISHLRLALWQLSILLFSASTVCSGTPPDERIAGSGCQQVEQLREDTEPTWLRVACQVLDEDPPFGQLAGAGGVVTPSIETQENKLTPIKQCNNSDELAARLIVLLDCNRMQCTMTLLSTSGLRLGWTP